jgi:hypothetical protein
VLFVGTQPVEGAFVTRDRAQAIYRSITERRRDPALVSWSGPDFVEVSVFPVEAKNRRTVELEWIEPTATRDGLAWYRLPVIAHEGNGPRWPSRISVDGTSIHRFGRTWLLLGTAGSSGTAAVAREPGSPAQASQPGATRVVIVVETSREMSAEKRTLQRASIERFLEALSEDVHITLLGADWAIADVTEEAPPALVRAALDHLDEITSAGALDLESALLAASARARAMGARHIVFFGHGADAFRGDAMAAPLREMQQAGQSLLVIGSDAAPMVDAAALTGGQALPWTTTAAGRIAALLERGLPEMTVENAERYFPLDTVTGETRWLARFVGSAPERLARAPVRDLDALWARAHIAGSMGRDGEEGVRHRVVTPLTSLLVLESPEEYARWGIPEPAPQPTAQLAAGNVQRSAGLLGLSGTVSILGQSSPVGDVREGLLGATITESAGAVNRFQAVGSAYGAAFGRQASQGKGVAGLFALKADTGDHYARRALKGEANEHHAGQVTSGESTVQGSLDKEIIRRIVRRHMGEVKYCYESELAKKPDLAGRVAIRFAIAATGTVMNATLDNSTIRNPTLEKCIVGTIRNWPFPAPMRGDIVTVTFPFYLAPVHSTFVPNTPTPVAPPTPWNVALEALRDKAPLSQRMATIASVLGAPVTDRPAVLAFWIVERHLRGRARDVGACILAANLLREGNRPHEAARILSEAAPIDLVAITAEFSRWNNTPDVRRLTELSERK